MTGSRRVVGQFLLLGSLLLEAGLTAREQQIVVPLVIKLDGSLTATPNPGGGSVIGPRIIDARVIVPGGQPPTGQAKLFGVSGHPRLPVGSFISGVLTTGAGVINFAEVTPRDGRPMTTAVRITNVRANYLAGRAGETFIITAPAIQSMPVQRFDSAFRETSPRIQETLADGTRLTYWRTPLEWNLVPQFGVAQPIGWDFGLAFSNADLTGSIDYMQLNSDPNATVLVSCLGPTGTTPTCTFAGAGTLREHFGTAVVRSLASLGLNPTQFIGASALDLSEQPFRACPPGPPPFAAAPVFLRDAGTRFVGMWNNVPCAAGYDLRVETNPPSGTLYQQRIVGGTAFAVGDPGGVPDDLALDVNAFNAFGAGGTGRGPLITIGLPPVVCPTGFLPPPTNLRLFSDRLNTGVALGWDSVDCAVSYVVRVFRTDGTRPDGASETFEIASNGHFDTDVRRPINFMEVASRGADGNIGPFSPRVQVVIPPARDRGGEIHEPEALGVRFNDRPH